MGVTVSPHAQSTATIRPSDPGGAKPEPTSPEHDAAPDGGLQAWLVAAGGACTIFSCLGFANSFGVFQEYYVANQLRAGSSSKISWIGSLCTFLQIAAGGLGARCLTNMGHEPAAVVYGVLLGTAMAFLQLPAFAVVSQYFDKNKAAALGLIVSGSSIGGVVSPFAVSKMLNSSSLRLEWSVHIMGFVVVPMMAFACTVVKPRLPPRTTSFFIPEAFTQAQFDLIIAAFFFMFVGLSKPLLYLPTYAVTRGMDATLDSTGVVGLCMATAESTAGLVLTLCVKDARDSGTYLGMGIAASSVAALIGALFDHYGGFLQASIFSGVLSLAGGFIAFGAKAMTTEGLLGRLNMSLTSPLLTLLCTRHL
ncbi:uncharacterized protein BO97DRAFT_467039 [Aspergillus homomorphus CBS 101889]|uniref:MFS general substrate transporter n=1 Tax=Aspergillus homomorphus (strain CBS 101889) TaxID=1450537 RepID=A0A395IE94_ASPHC|nr:hypothetical protein BO97DRAFT_467039 [Aspergillus homomorphus CBS 101889]RAL17478.1 hypothetical protein BO97DRAFT_467039 [Aspergillus homomorphus CBS 101889]